jgi:excisionase family DNA binding protein
MDPEQNSRPVVRLDERLALRPEEAARVLGVSERTLRSWLPELPHVRRGGVVLIPVDPLREWLQEQARAGRSRIDAAVEDALRSLER